jgi:hypothetical protein
MNEAAATIAFHIMENWYDENIAAARGHNPWPGSWHMSAWQWRNLPHELDRTHLVTLATADGRVAQRSAATPGQQAILHALDRPEPPKFLDFTIETETTS